MNILEIDTGNRRQVQQFLQLPFSIYAGTPQWVPPLAMDARKMLDRHKHPFYGYGRAAFLLALDGGRPVGRLAVLDNARYNQFNHAQAVVCRPQPGEDRAQRRAAGGFPDGLPGYLGGAAA